MKLAHPLSLLSLLLAACTVLLTACGERQADVSTPSTYSSGGLTFQYPKNWKVTQDNPMEGLHNVTVETPGDAIVLVQTFGAEEGITTRIWAEEFSKLAAAATPIGTMSTPAWTDLPEHRGYSRVREDFDISLLNQTVPHERIVATRIVGTTMVSIVFQVAKEDLKKVEDGFTLIMDSIEFQETKKPDGDGAKNG